MGRQIKFGGRFLLPETRRHQFDRPLAIPWKGPSCSACKSLCSTSSARAAAQLFGRVMNANLASIMPQVVAVWCEELGPRRPLRLLHRLRGSRARAAGRHRRRCSSAPSPTRRRLAYAISNSAGSAAPSPCSADRTPAAIPKDAAHYFDYVLGFTDKATDRRGAARLRAAPAVGLQLSGAAPAGAAARRARALEVHRADDRQGADRQDRAR